VSFKTYNIVFLFLFVGFVTCLGIFISLIDPYWLFHNDPIWNDRNHGCNRILDIKQRFTKPLQVFFARPKIVFVGSSRVYRGIPTEIYANNYELYNFGISSMRIRELQAYTLHAVRWAPVEKVVLGIDLFMFNNFKKCESGFDPDTNSLGYLYKSLLTSLMTTMAIDDVRTVLKGTHSNDGYWTKSGFKHSNPRSVKQILKILKSFYVDKFIVTEDEYNSFYDLIDKLKYSGIDVTVYISPLNRIMIERMREKGRYKMFLSWKNLIKKDIQEKNIKFFDFSEINPFFDDNMMSGSTNYWIDTSHFSPIVGDWIIRKLSVLK